MTSSTYKALRDAVLKQQQVIVMYHGYRRECCPHTLGYTDGHEQVLTFQFAGGSSSGLPPGGQWRCMKVREISEIIVKDGPWHTGLRHTRPQTCVKQIDVETFAQAA
jgi:hypothetical protein